MKTAKLLHNPKAGDEAYTKKQLLTLLESAGINGHYGSTKTQSWKDLDPAIDFLVVAGCDGTVRQVAQWLLNQKELEKPLPIGLLPIGTANNIAKTLGISGPLEAIISHWPARSAQPYDVGWVTGLPKTGFFLESCGYGLFPQLMQYMKDKPSTDTPEKKLQQALAVFEKLIRTDQPQHYQLEVDGVDYSGHYLLIEVMNTRSVGPNLALAPEAEPGDGWLEVVLVAESRRQQLAAWIAPKRQQAAPFGAIRAKTIRIHAAATLLHVDDELMDLKTPKTLMIEVQPGRLSFL